MSESTRHMGAPDPGSGTAETRSAVPRPGVAGLIEDVLRDRRDEELARRAARLRHDLRAPHGILLVAGAKADVELTARALVARLHRSMAVPAFDAVPPHVTVVLPVVAPAVWTHAVRLAEREAAVHGTLVLVRPPVSGLRALRAAYHRSAADAALAVPADLLGPLVHPEDLVIPRMLAVLDAADQRSLLAPLEPILALPPLHRDAYLRTVDTLRRNGGSLLRTAQALHLHVNSVRRRIDRIEELTGRRLEDPADRLVLDLGVILLSLRGAPQPPRPRHDDPGLVLMDSAAGWDGDVGRAA